MRIKVDAGVAHYFRQAGAARDNYRGTTNHRLQGWNAETFVQGGVDQSYAAAIQLCQMFVRHVGILLNRGVNVESSYKLSLFVVELWPAYDAQADITLDGRGLGKS